MTDRRAVLCRSCGAFCPIQVTIEDGRAVSAVGDREAPLYGGFSCPKGRAMPEMHNNPARLKHSLRRRADGSYEEISSDEAVRDIAHKLEQIIERHGADSVAGFLGGPSIEQPVGSALMRPFLTALGSSSFFSSLTLDQPGMLIAEALHGGWQGGRQRQDSWDVFLLVGGNPVISKQYFAANPGQQLKKVFGGKAKLIVIDPRRTETARRAEVHLQGIPGEDPTILAGLLHLILKSGTYDRTFVESSAEGLEALVAAVSGFTPDYVAERAGVAQTDLESAARLLSRSRRGDVGLGTGPSMATRGNLSAYLGLCIQTVMGFWAREGDTALGPSVLLPSRTFRAQPTSPRPITGFGRKLRVRGLQESVVGLPTSALPDEILTPGPGQVRALFMNAGAMMTWPQQDRVKEAFASLDLLVVPDVDFSPTARVATHVLATRMPLEVAATSQKGEMLRLVHPGYGWDQPFGFYSPAVVEPPADADLIETWQIYYRVLKHMGRQLCLPVSDPVKGRHDLPLDMEHEPETDALLALTLSGSRIPLASVKEYPHGHVFDEARETVLPREASCTARLQLADPLMLKELAQVRAERAHERRGTNDEFPFLLTVRRMQNVTNSSHRQVPGLLRETYNPAFMNPADMQRLDLQDDVLISIASRHGEIFAVARADGDLRPGVVSMTHGFGANPGEPTVPRRDGANTNRLLRMDSDYDQFTGLPRMSAVPVRVGKAAIEKEMEHVSS